MGPEKALRSGSTRRADGDSGPAAADRPAPAADPSPVPAGLIVGRFDDPAEAAADRMADVALARLRALPPLSRPGVADAAPDTPAIARSTTRSGGAVIGAAGGDLDAGTERLIDSARAGGTPLPSPVLNRMQTAFGRGLSGVRIHHGPAAARANSAISARAFTTGSDVFFGAGQFAPDTPDGERVLAHELAHVVQGNESGGPTASGGLRRSPAKDPATRLQEKQAAEKKRQQDKQRKQQQQQAKKEQAAKQRADKKQQAARDKADKKQAKQNAKESKASEKQQSKRLAADRAEGIAGRAALSGEVGTGNTSAGANTLKDEFELALESEQGLFTEYVRRGLPDDAARDQAYRETWLLGPQAQRLKPVRPPRETASERLRSDVRVGRLNENLRKAMDSEAELGSMLPTAVESRYEQFATEVDRLMGPPDSLSLQQAEAMAEKSVWATAPEKVRKKRPPRGSELDIQAAKDARRRLGVRTKPSAGASVSDTVAGISDQVGSVLGIVNTLSPAVIGPLGSTGASKDSAAKEARTGQKSEPTGGGEQQIPMGVVAFIKSVQDSASRLSKGDRTGPAVSNVTLSDETRASNGISTILGIFGDLKSLVDGGMKLANSVKTAHSERSARAIMAATKSGADGAKTVVSLAKNAASMAKMIDAGVTSAVASVVPGLNIATSVLSIVSNTMSMGDAAMRMYETNQAVFAARARKIDPREPVDVMVLPLLRVAQSHTKKLEQTVWNTSVSLADLATSIATVASGGGYGIPAAVQAGVKVVDMLHSFGHFVSEQVMVAITKQIQSDSLQSLEGSAEKGFRHDPAMAVDGIVQRATTGDTVAQEFLSNYRVDGKPIDMVLLAKLNPQEARKQAAGADAGASTATGNELLLGKVRAAVLAAMAEDQDPQFFYEKWRKDIGDKIDLVRKHTTGKWSTIDSLAKDRNERDAGDRGVGWKMKMMFTSRTKVDRKARQQQVLGARVAGPVRDPNILCVCGGAELRADASGPDQEKFLGAVKAMSDQVILDSAKDPANGEWQELLLEVIRVRVADKVAASSAP